MGRFGDNKKEYFKVWVEIERIVEEEDIYEDAGDLPMSTQSFETLEEAEEHRLDIIQMFGG